MTTTPMLYDDYVILGWPIQIAEDSKLARRPGVDACGDERACRAGQSRWLKTPNLKEDWVKMYVETKDLVDIASCCILEEAYMGF